ncbi:MFS transporter [Chromohalobacter canadensis]|uniref:MFS transporter n=1 Tax=Chromohalobacter canadensis TaxID=141389 RepID=UPI00240FCFC8|nr:MFS transporter [Chromohalobacter canadensis]
MKKAPEKSHYLLIITVILCYSVVGVSFGALPVILINEERFSHLTLGVVIGSYAFTAIPSRIVGGFLMNKFGYRNFLIIAAFILSASTSLVLLASSPAHFLLTRLCLGIGVGFMMSVTTAWIVDLPTNTGLASKLGSIGTLNYLVLAFGAPLGAYVSNIYDGRQTLFLSSILPLLGAIISFKIHNPKPKKRRGTRKAFIMEAFKISFLPGVVLMTSGFGYASIVSFGVDVAKYKNLAWPGAVVFTFGFVMVSSRIFITKYIERYKESAICSLFFMLEALGLGIISYFKNFLLIILGTSLVALGMAFIYPFLGKIVAYSASNDVRGTALAIFGSFINLGIGIGSILLGGIASISNVAASFGFAAFITSFGALAYFLKTSNKHTS